MDLLDRYLAAVAALLPRDQREDIVAELRDILLNRMEEKEAELGRPLTANEREAVLKAFGHPIAVAGRFGATRSLIGPEIYPFYLFGVKALLVVAAIVSAIPAVITVITSPAGAAGALSQFLSGFLSSGFTLIGVATVLGVGFERGWIPRTGFADWKVADLPILDALAPPKMGLFLKRPLERRFEALLEMILTALFILWWTGLVQTPWSNRITDSDMVLQPGAVWATLYWPILGMAGLQLVSSLVGLLRPSWVRGRAALELAGSAAGLALAVVLQ
ncbi:HAAS signaling domain-containing protein, partial [Caulobacter sp.]|uniref:HAAS signaling domain-containing protein n=1 Tax=Caulobacter sp. TaxID=78 RepID=UPI003BB18D3D